MNWKFFIILSLSLGVAFSAPSFLSFAHAETQSSKITTEILYIINLGKNTHLVHYNVCAGNEIVWNPILIVFSNQDFIEVNLKKHILANTCQSYESIIKADYSNQIQVMVFP
ncbi:MAG TPA: hypothetical protein VLA01_03390 [Nitrosopumilaceae archaeon]|nr:hypothetical protein [Nitrosopumilaceae archaeon]